MILGKRKTPFKLNNDTATTVDQVKRVMASLDSIMYFTKQVGSFDRIQSRLEMMSRVNVDRDQVCEIVRLLNEKHLFYDISSKFVFHLPQVQKQVSEILVRKSKIAEILKDTQLVAKLGAVLEGDYNVLMHENPLKKMKVVDSKLFPKKEPTTALDILMSKKPEKQLGSPATSESNELPVKLSAKERIQALKERVLQRKKQRENATKNCDLSHLTETTATADDSESNGINDPQNDLFLSHLMDMITTKFLSDKRVQANCKELSVELNKLQDYPIADIMKGMMTLSRYFLKIEKSKYFKCYTWKDENTYLRCIPMQASKVFHKQEDQEDVVKIDPSK